MMINEEGRNFDKMKIALAIRNSVFNSEISCSLLSNEIINNCETCTLKCICDGVEELVEDYKKRTIKVISSFNFQNL